MAKKKTRETHTLSERNILKRAVVLPPHTFSRAMMKSMTAFAQTVMPKNALPSTDDPKSARLHPVMLQAMQAEYFPPENDERTEHYGLLYGKERKRGNELFYGLDIELTDIPNDVS